LLVDLRARFGLTYLFISHDLSVVRLIADRVAVMSLGRIVEIAPAEEIFTTPLHPYTRALLASVPDIGRREPPVAIRGEIPSSLTTLRGCPFESRCPDRLPACADFPPRLDEVAQGRHVACFLHHREVDAERIEPAQVGAPKSTPHPLKETN